MRFVGPTLLGLFLAGCTARHPHRVSPKELQRLVQKADPFVLVFGSVRTLDGTRDITAKRIGGGTAIRFVHGGPPLESEVVLNEVSILSGDRFYAVLRAPAQQPYLDHFAVRIRWADPSYDPVTHIRLAERSTPLALYLGRIEISVSGPSSELQRLAPKRILAVVLVDDFATARAELAKLYPKFTGEVRKAPALR